MSWFNHVSLSSDQQRQLSATDGFCGPTTTMAAPDRTGVSSPGLEGFPSALQSVVCPPTLENLTCGSSGGQVREPEPISYASLQEQRCVLSWFQGWSPSQRERFLQDLVKDRLPSIFECQLRLWTQWFESWGEEERNHFLHILEERDPTFVAHFYNCVAGTAGRD
ncbi:uncharacterized protein C14orf119 homolog isoform X2 [Dunckerocampus dactyliophorus]|uniref:uncharacterized protein C14orf119 homolog isoform X2 n=1 Tax=Dunckerocampus dactyliophorus TaxID=161453 RepID=UPI0024054F00|nr:uncharacterized protein C14orf119 homolog isoform X2 [Dunckerocampus dactyliophorus]